MTQLCLRKLDLKIFIIFAHLHRLWGWKVLTNTILKSIFSDLKGPFCIQVMRIKYCISPKSYYTVMNIPSHCQEPGGGAPWCLPYWWAIILLKGSVWTRSQEAWIFSCGASKPCGSSWAAVIPVSADPPPHCTKQATEDAHYLSRGVHQPTGWDSEERGDICGSFLQMSLCMFRNQGCSISSQAPDLWVILVQRVILIHVLHLVVFTSSPRKLRNSHLMDTQGYASPIRYAYSALLPIFLKDPKSRLRHFSLAKGGRGKSRNKIWIKTSGKLRRMKTLGSRSRNKFYSWHLFAFITNEMQSSDYTTSLQALKS